MTTARNPIRRLALAILLALGVLTTSMPQAQAAPGVVLCGAAENGDGTTTFMSMDCQGVGELAGIWLMTLSDDGRVSGHSPTNGGTLEGTYTRSCDIFVSVTVTVCYVITAEVCVNGNCVSVVIVICFTRTVTVCITVSFNATGTGTGTYLS